MFDLALGERQLEREPPLDALPRSRRRRRDRILTSAGRLLQSLVVRQRLEEELRFLVKHRLGRGLLSRRLALHLDLHVDAFVWLWRSRAPAPRLLQRALLPSCRFALHAVSNNSGGARGDTVDGGDRLLVRHLLAPRLAQGRHRRARHKRRVSRGPLRLSALGSSRGCRPPHHVTPSSWQPALTSASVETLGLRPITDTNGTVGREKQKKKSGAKTPTL